MMGAQRFLVASRSVVTHDAALCDPFLRNATHLIRDVPALSPAKGTTRALPPTVVNSSLHLHDNLVSDLNLLSNRGVQIDLRLLGTDRHNEAIASG